MDDEPDRSRHARAAAEAALVRVVFHYGGRPEFVVLGGLVPELLCSQSALHHAGTTDVDVQVDLEIASGAVNAARLESALWNAGFEPTNGRVWRWQADGPEWTIVKFELLSDLETEPSEATVRFHGCEHLGAVNLRGSRFAARDVQVRSLQAEIDGERRTVEINVTGLAGFLLAKAAAARARGKTKDWYDIAFVLLHNDAGGPSAAAHAVRRAFADDLGAVRVALEELAGNFSSRASQGPQAYAQQMRLDHPELVDAVLRADAMLAVAEFCGLLTSGR